MEYRRLGSAGVRVSALSLGAWVTFGGQVGEDVAQECMTRAYDAGVNFFDNAEAYADGNAEIVMGAALKKLGWARDTFLVSSKVFWGGSGPNQQGLSRKHVFEACHAALRRLRVEYLDFFFCHRPDPSTPIEETTRVMHDLVTQGKVLYWGTSEWSAQQIAEACQLADQRNLYRPQMEQPEYNMFHRERVEREYRELYARYGLGTTTWSPLMSGLLSGKYLDGIPHGTRVTLPGYAWLKQKFESDVTRSRLGCVRKLKGLADSLECTLAQLALAWCLKNPHVSTVITGASRPEQVTENMRALDVLPRLTDEVMARIETTLREAAS
ncbi:MAG: aldo/keto reductase [Candidatus Wallbacteria bacterium]|nr:aldo/keto reductase [Candidatus Wallbacteria bacterium]